MFIVITRIKEERENVYIGRRKVILEFTQRKARKEKKTVNIDGKTSHYYFDDMTFLKIKIQGKRMKKHIAGKF